MYARATEPLTAAALPEKEEERRRAAPPSWLRAAVPAGTLWLLVNLVAFLAGPAARSRARIVDSDGYMHVVRLLEIVGRSTWQGGLTLRDGAPGGFALHWTMPFDLLLLACAAPLAPVLGWQAAIPLVAPLVGPVTGLLLILALTWTLAPGRQPELAALAALTAALSPPVLAYGMAGRVDHHVLLVAGCVLLAGTVVRGLGAAAGLRHGAATGLAAAGCLWLSVETLPAVAAALAVLGLCGQGGSLRSSPMLRACAVAFPLGLAAALLLDPPAERHETDQISAVYLVFSLLAGAVLLALAGPPLARMTLRCRVLAATILAGIAAGIWVLTFPSLLAGTGRYMEPWVGELIWAGIAELRPPRWPATWLLLLSPGLLGAAGALWLCWRDKGGAGALGWGVLLGANAALLAAAARHGRLAPYLAVAGAVPLAAVALQVARAVAERLPGGRLSALARAATLALAVSVPWLLGALAHAALERGGAEGSSAPAAPAALRCDVSAAAEALRQHEPTGAGARIVLTDLGLAPELLFSTRHRTVAGPYHRNGAGLADTFRFFLAEDEAEALAIVRRRQVDLVLICPGSLDGALRTHGTAASLRARLEAGRPPSWLMPVRWPAGLITPLRLYAVRP